MEILWNLILERVKKGKEKKKEKKLGGRAVRSVIEQGNVTHPFLSRFSEMHGCAKQAGSYRVFHGFNANSLSATSIEQLEWKNV